MTKTVIQAYKNFWKDYKPYKLHPADDAAISKRRNATSLVEYVNFEKLKKQYRDLNDPDNNEMFKASINKSAIHSNMYCKPFIGNIETAKLVILCRNPSLGLRDYQDEHCDEEYKTALNNELNFDSNGFLYLTEASTRTAAFDYWNGSNKIPKLLDVFSSEQLKDSICVLQSVGYHSLKTPKINPEILPSSLMARKLVHSYLLPKAKRKEIFIFSRYSSSFWGLDEDSHVMIRKPTAARWPFFADTEANRIIQALRPLID